MRLIETVPHDRFTIQLFAWNGKYILKIELDKYEQVYKIGETEVMGTGELKKVLTPDFLQEVLKQFVSMRSLWLESVKDIII